MAKEELFHVPVMGFFLPLINAFPVRRNEGDVGAVRTAQRHLKAGGSMVVFPEGRRQKNGVLGRPRGGVGLLATSTGTPVVPVYLHNTHRAWRFPKFEVIFGSPLTALPGERNDVFAHRVMNAIKEMME
jgi:1-acyl-sn-glycerol-3-phosphate acyltransferase